MVSGCILGISMSTRLTGLAIIQGTSLLDYGIKLHKEKWSDTKAQKIITSLQSRCTHFNIQNIVLSIPHEYYQTQSLVHLIEKINETFKEKNVSITMYSIRETFSYFKLFKKEKKKPFQQKITEVFPELEQYILPPSTNTSRYYDKLFEAVGVVLLHSSRKTR
jgi:RNase H-fold protein (predicted Holliday junction resolvase)